MTAPPKGTDIHSRFFARVYPHLLELAPLARAARVSTGLGPPLSTSTTERSRTWKLLRRVRLCSVVVKLRRRLRAPWLALAASLLFAACGQDSEAPSSVPARAETSREEAAGHIHGLGVDPADGSLIIATHYGLFRAPEGETEAPRLGDSRQDVMGFSVLGPNRFLGSGHPAPGDNQPPLLGLIESRDAGRRWKPISLLGKADFHVLRSAGSRVYGFDSSQGRLLVSDDFGRSWAPRTPPGFLIDLAIDPDDGGRAVASTEDALVVTRNAGETWRPLQTRTAGLLAWPAPDRLYLIDGAGSVFASSDAGRSWRDAGSIGGQPVAFATHEDELYAALQDGRVVQSADGGKTWNVRAAL